MTTRFRLARSGVLLAAAAIPAAAQSWTIPTSGPRSLGSARPAISGAVAHWTFTDHANPTADSVGGHNGNLIGGAAFNCQDNSPVGRPGCSLALGGGGDVVEVADAPALGFGPTSPMTVALWFKFTGSETVMHILSKRIGCIGVQDINYQFAFDSNSAERLQFASQGGIVGTGLPVQPNTWMHMAATYDGAGTLRVYVNGVEAANRTGYVLSGANTDPLRIGAGGSCGGNFDGLIDEVWIFDRALAPAEIGVLAGTNPATYCTPKVNSLGCTPSIGWTGVPSATGPDEFFVTASNVFNRKLGMMLWSLDSTSTPFGGGTLCLRQPIVRTTAQSSGGSSAGSDCSGGYSYHFSQTYMVQRLLSAGTTVYAQYWSRDPGFASPNNIGLTDAVQFTICP